MNREFLINTAILLTANVLVKPFYLFGIDRTIQNEVGAASYGLYFALFNFTFLLQIVNDFGIQNYNNRNISRHRQLVGKYFPNILAFKLLLGVAYMALVLFLGWLAGYGARVYWLMLPLAGVQILSSLLYYLRSNLSGLGYYRTDSLLSALDKLLLILICGWLLWGYTGEFRIEWLAYAQVAALGLTALIAFLLLRPHLGPWRFRFRPLFLLHLVKESYPYALVILLMTVYTRIDAVMIERLLPGGEHQAGVYASAYRLLDASNMVGFLLAGLLLPMFARLLKEGQSVRSLVQMSFQMILAGSLSLSALCWFFQEEIMVLLYTDADRYWGEVLGWLMLAFVAVSGTYVYGTLLTANGNLRRMNLIFLFSILLNIGLNWWLIPQQQATGAAIATVITQFFALFSQMALAHRILQLPGEKRIWLRILGFAGSVILLGWALREWSAVLWPIRLLIMSLGAIGLSFAWRLLAPRKWSAILRQA